MVWPLLTLIGTFQKGYTYKKLLVLHFDAYRVPDSIRPADLERFSFFFVLGFKLSYEKVNILKLNKNVPFFQILLQYLKKYMDTNGNKDARV